MNSLPNSHQRLAIGIDITHSTALLSCAAGSENALFSYTARRLRYHHSPSSSNVLLLLYV